MTTYTDEYLEHYADRYMALRLRRHGVSLEDYLADPGRYEPLALEPLPLLPKQRMVAHRLRAQEEAEKLNRAFIRFARTVAKEYVAAQKAREAERPVENLPRRNGAVVEPLRHHRWPRRAHKAFFDKKAN